MNDDHAGNLIQMLDAAEEKDFETPYIEVVLKDFVMVMEAEDRSDREVMYFEIISARWGSSTNQKYKQRFTIGPHTAVGWNIGGKTWINFKMALRVFHRLSNRNLQKVPGIILVVEL